MSNLTQANIEALKATKNETEWNKVCDAIKKEHWGYPADWFPKVMMSGLSTQIMSGWETPKSADLQVQTMQPGESIEEFLGITKK